MQKLIVRDLNTSELWEGDVAKLEDVIEIAANNADDDGFTVRVICNDPGLDEENMLDSIQLRKQKSGRYMARRSSDKPYRWFKFIGWLFRVRRIINNADCEVVIQIGRLTAKFDDTEISLVLKRKKGPFINRKSINL